MTVCLPPHRRRYIIVHVNRRITSWSEFELISFLVNLNKTVKTNDTVLRTVYERGKIAEYVLSGFALHTVVFWGKDQVYNNEGVRHFWIEVVQNIHPRQ